MAHPNIGLSVAFAQVVLVRSLKVTEIMRQRNAWAVLVETPKAARVCRVHTAWPKKECATLWLLP